MSSEPWQPFRLAMGNYIDAMAMIRRAAWAAAGGYQCIEVPGWEDYDLWCSFVELGMRGIRVAKALAHYRVHSSSMLGATTNAERTQSRMISVMKSRDFWIDPAFPTATAPSSDSEG